MGRRVGWWGGRGRSCRAWWASGWTWAFTSPGRTEHWKDVSKQGQGMAEVIPAYLSCPLLGLLQGLNERA